MGRSKRCEVLNEVMVGYGARRRLRSDEVSRLALWLSWSFTLHRHEEPYVLNAC